MWKHGTLLPSQGVKELSGFLSSGHRGLGLFLKVPRDCHTSLHVFFFFLYPTSSSLRSRKL